MIKRASILLAAVAITVFLISGVLLTLMRDAGAETAFVVDSTGDSADINVGDGACDADDSTPGNQCTLRAAIQEANSAMGPDAIHFGMPGDGVHTIELTSQLPTLSDVSGPTTIDGYTQVGSFPNTDPLASNAKIMVQIEGAGTDPDLFGGLAITSPGNVVRGLALYKLRGAIRLLGADAHDNRIAGNFLGTDAAGLRYPTERVPLYAPGVKIDSGASKNIIGGALAADRNVISGNATQGVGLHDPGTDFNSIVGNLIGLTPSGKGRLANHGHGVDINNGASYNIVGGTLPGERNVISCNGSEGVEVSHHTNGFPTANRVIGNFIGTALSGARAPFYTRNGSNGVHVEDGAKDTVVSHNIIGNNQKSGVAIHGSRESFTTGNKVYANRIGISRSGAAIPNGRAGVRIVAGAKGSRVGPDNIIANNPTGVQVGDIDTYLGDINTDTNTVTRNSIYGNLQLGIDLGVDGPTQNDLGDADLGPNGLQNKPAIASAVTSGGVTTIEGTLNSTPNSTFLIRYFSNPSGDDEGMNFLGQKRVTTDGNGDAKFSFSTAQAVRSGNVTATATDEADNTSEFSTPIGILLE